MYFKPILVRSIAEGIGARGRAAWCAALRKWMRWSGSLTGSPQMPQRGYESRAGVGWPLGNMMARYFCAIDCPSVVFKGAGLASGAAGTKAMGSFQRPRL